MKGSMDDYIDEIRGYDQKLQAVGYQVDDDDLVFYALKGLPEEYKPIRAALNAKGDIMFSDLATILKNEESQILRDESLSAPKVFLTEFTVPTTCNSSQYSRPRNWNGGSSNQGSNQSWNGGSKNPFWNGDNNAATNGSFVSQPQTYQRVPPQSQTYAVVTPQSQPTVNVSGGYFSSPSSSVYQMQRGSQVMSLPQPPPQAYITTTVPQSQGPQLFVGTTPQVYAGFSANNQVGQGGVGVSDYSGVPSASPNWLFDSGASTHVTNDLVPLTTFDNIQIPVFSSSFPSSSPTSVPTLPTVIPSSEDTTSNTSTERGVKEDTTSKLISESSRHEDAVIK
ncbi:hypothetical protein Vadar_022372 [Vaccinium darrowii]|uniref:Uncharacterized protein n=1 Tax=Vaccinium darrowii TaxID=229202 RepID=A0ACB7XC34_9ERIC|nr:hypothetical protein Vadar_022372 [Vaccinium darrowii]